MTGMLIGLALLIGGGAMHDENYQPNDPRLRQVGPDRWSDRREGAGYVMGMAGGAILAWHLHEYLEERIGGELPIRLGLGRALVGGLAGGGLVGIGLIVHNDDARGDRDRRYSYRAQRTNDYREHLGFLLGPLGGATAALSIKGYRKGSDARQVEIYRSASLLRHPYVQGENHFHVRHRRSRRRGPYHCLEVGVGAGAQVSVRDSGALSDWYLIPGIVNTVEPGTWGQIKASLEAAAPY